ncbi:hypothetical protein PR048_020418 [Dryococelus australis]|uniref:Reverse transcriptase RNase H-like domain-containing protein n=1 Tax=Dryococelus australis TaxID=614101 RepID=A0ABQ9H688_9NEOP|nr:hypothetical protein PR048_020418 [Dryococelus australis]
MPNRLLLEDNDLTFDKACQIVLNMESANQSANKIISPNQQRPGIDKILEGIKYWGAYRNDILIGGKDYNSCKSVLYAALSLFCESLELLGCVRSADGLSSCKFKIEKLINTKSPQNVTQLKSYLGLFNYYHKFIKMAPDVMEPLHNLLRNSVSWEWTDELLFDPTKPTILIRDSSSYGVGAILSQLHDGIEKLVAFESAIQCSEKLEALSIIYGVTKFHKYLVENQCTIVADHELLLPLFSGKKKIPQVTDARLLRWSIILSSYQYKLQYKKGMNIQNANVCLVYQIIVLYRYLMIMIVILFTRRLHWCHTKMLLI